MLFRYDTVIGDPLFETALFKFEDEDGNKEFNYSLCYEVHGNSNEHFNFISDKCVSVNGFYTLTAIGNIISSMGVRATDNSGSCQNISVIQDQISGKCELYASGVQITGEYELAGISAKLSSDSTKVHVSVPNCAERLPLVMLFKCQNVADRFMIRFDIMHGVSLRPTSHGLLGENCV